MQVEDRFRRLPRLELCQILGARKLQNSVCAEYAPAWRAFNDILIMQQPFGEQVVVVGLARLWRCIPLRWQSRPDDEFR